MLNYDRTNVTWVWVGRWGAWPPAPCCRCPVCGNCGWGSPRPWGWWRGRWRGPATPWCWCPSSLGRFGQRGGRPWAGGRGARRWPEEFSCDTNWRARARWWQIGWTGTAANTLGCLHSGMSPEKLYTKMTNSSKSYRELYLFLILFIFNFCAWIEHKLKELFDKFLQ